MMLIRVPTLLILVIFTSSPIYQTSPVGCKPGCTNWLSIEEHYHQADAVFLGVVESHFRPDTDIPFYKQLEEAYVGLSKTVNLPSLTPAGYPAYTTFKVIASWKGIKKTTITLQTGKTGCWHQWIVDETHERMLLVFAVEEGGELRTHCGLIYEVTGVEELGRYSFPNSPLELKASRLAGFRFYGFVVGFVLSLIILFGKRYRTTNS